jgi:hypothetical protein
MDQAMADEGVAGALRQRLQQSLFNTADWMRNQEEVTRLQPLA